MTATVYEVTVDDRDRYGIRSRRFYFSRQKTARKALAKARGAEEVTQARLRKVVTPDLPLRELVCLIANNPNAEWKWRAEKEPAQGSKEG